MQKLYRVGYDQIWVMWSGSRCKVSCTYLKILTQVLHELVVPEGPTLYPTEAYKALPSPADSIDVTERSPVERARSAVESTAGDFTDNPQVASQVY